MTWHVVSLNDVAPTAWRNGGGTTRELFAWPAATAWKWRVSVAEVAASGPFSTFAGVHRWFAVLEGGGVCLTVANTSHELDLLSAPFAFDGAALTTCELRSSPTLDFNLMLQGGTTAAVRRINDEQSFAVNTPKIIAVYTHKTGATVRIDHKILHLLPYSFGWCSTGTPVAVQVQASDALFMEVDA